ncbi:MAG: hypothetical protein EXR12_01650 [Rhodospirillaceae bacterium]|nr:hypothetical protein [Rhodospirillaceae bacterium]
MTFPRPILACGTPAATSLLKTISTAKRRRAMSPFVGHAESDPIERSRSEINNLDSTFGVGK